MSTLEEAKSAIESEIAQIEARLALLKISLEHLDAAIQQPDVGRQTVVSGHGAKPIKAAPAISTRTAKNHKPLPKTGESFWLQFMSQEPKLSGDLFSPALAALSIKPTSDNAKILRQRLSVVLSTMAKKGVIKAIGTGRSKQYAKA
jgi:hypothetical protein